MLSAYSFCMKYKELLYRLAPVLISLIGILVFKWDVSTFLLYFYLDSIFIILFSFLKSGKAMQSDSIWGKFTYDPKAYPVTPLRFVCLGLYSLFFLVSFGMVYYQVGFNGASLYTVLMALTVTGLNYSYDYFQFIQKETYKTVTAAFCLAQSFKRVFVFFLPPILFMGSKDNYLDMVYLVLITHFLVEIYFWKYEWKHR